MESVSTFFKEEKDFLYRKGRKEKELKVITNMITKSDLSDEQISVIAETTVEFVKGMRNDLKN